MAIHLGSRDLLPTTFVIAKTVDADMGADQQGTDVQAPDAKPKIAFRAYSEVVDLTYQPSLEVNPYGVGINLSHRRTGSHTVFGTFDPDTDQLTYDNCGIQILNEAEVKRQIREMLQAAVHQGI